MRYTGLVLLTILVGSLGCSPISAGKQALKEIGGASAKVIPIKGASDNAFRKYGDVKLTRAESDIGPLCPPRYLDALRKEFANQRNHLRTDRFIGGGTVLNVDLVVTYHQKGGGVSAALGKDSLCVARTRFSPAGGEPVADVLVIAKSEAMRTGTSELAKAMAKGIVDYLKNKYGKSKK